MFHQPGRRPLGRREEMAPATLSSRRWCQAPSLEKTRCRGWYWNVDARKKGPGGPRERIMGA
eukprot:6040268-Alexandrium_andersonii.AAC.1